MKTDETRKIYLDCNYMTSAEKAHRYLKEQMDFPDYYGENLDALYDMLTETGDKTFIRIDNGFAMEESKDGYGKKILNVFRLASSENDNLKVMIFDAADDENRTYRIKEDK